MKEQLITFETAKLAKEKEFFDKSNNGEIRLSQDNFYNENGVKFKFNDIFLGDKIGDLTKCYNAPTQSLLQKWLREKHNIHINIMFPINEDDYINTPLFKIQILEKIPQSLLKRYTTGSDFSTYEEALEKGLTEALKLIP
jgi:hypothetical protein